MGPLLVFHTPKRCALHSPLPVQDCEPNVQPKWTTATLRRQLPASLANQLHPILARDKAQLLWSTKEQHGVTVEIRASLQHLLAYTTDATDPWDVPLGLIVPLDHHLSSHGDTSFTRGGACCSTFCFWFDIAWLPRTIKGATQTKTTSDKCVDINALEFIVVILQLAAVLTDLVGRMRCWNL